MKFVHSLLLCTLMVPMLGCAIDDGLQPSTEGPPGETSAALTSTVFSGTVTNEQGVALAGATVIINGVSRTTSSAGKYYCSVPMSASGYQISVKKDGFSPVAEFSSAGKLDSLHTLKAAYVQQINPTQDSTVTSDTGVSVTVKANSLVDASGVTVTAPVKISIATYDPLRMPGDFTAMNASGQQVALESVGAISVSAALASNGAALKLKPGATADAFIPVPPEIGSMPPCVFDGSCRLAMWRFDAATGKWNERSANIQFGPSGTTFTMVSSGNSINITDNGGLGTWNADIEKTAPACTIVEFIGIPEECYNPADATSEPGIKLEVKLPNSSSGLATRADRVTSLMSFVALYNIRADATQQVGISFPTGAPAYCAGNLEIVSDQAPADFYPVLTTNGGATRFNSGAPWGGTGFPRKPGTNTNITFDDVALGNHPCNSYVSFQTSAQPVPPAKNAMTWSLLSSATNASHAYALVGSDPITNAYQGDTSTNNTLPVLCINENNAAYPGAGMIGSPVQTPGGAWRHTWSGGTVALTTPVKGTSLTSWAAANALCASQIGQGYRMAEFHDGDPTLWSGWDFWAEAMNADLTPFQGGRFWVAIDDQSANPW